MESNVENNASSITESISRMAALEDLARKVVSELDSSGFLSPPHGRSFRGTRMPLQGCGTDPHVVYDCASTPYVCTEEDNFSCAPSPPQFFNCGDFTCNDDQIGVDYECDPDRDFYCEVDFSCDDFVCDGGHVFICDGNNECTDAFTCKNSNPVNCTGAPYNQYNDGDDGTSGDFHCDFFGSANFDCTNDFFCEARDDFECGQNGGTFDCGSGHVADRFICDTGTNGEFHCHDNFTCDAAMDDFICEHDFTCGPPASEFVCTSGSYDPPC